MTGSTQNVQFRAEAPATLRLQRLLVEFDNLCFLIENVYGNRSLTGHQMQSVNVCLYELGLEDLYRLVMLLV